jgi:hypothetical protein
LNYFNSREVKKNYKRYEKRVHSEEFSHVKSANEIFLKACREYLNDSDEIRSVVNVGVFYPFVDTRLALEYPFIDFHGIDTIKTIEELNSRFKKQNLSFSTGNIMDYLIENKVDTLIHCRTFAYWSAGDVVGLYALCKELGVDIVGVEPCYENFKFNKCLKYDEIGDGWGAHDYVYLLNHLDFKVRCKFVSEPLHSRKGFGKVVYTAEA